MNSKSKFFLNSKFLNRARVVVKVFSLDKSKDLFKAFHSRLRHIVVLASGLARVGPRLRHFNKFLLLVTRTYRHHGSLYTVKWLKACHVSIQRYAAGEPYRSLREIEPTLPLPRLLNGLPAFIGSMDRKAIRELHTPTIRLWLSILSIYRVLQAPGKVDLSTITKPYGGNAVYLDVMSHNFYLLIEQFKVSNPDILNVSVRSLAAHHLKLSHKAGPNSSVSYLGLFQDAMAVFRSTIIANNFLQYALATNSSIYSLMKRVNSVGLTWNRIGPVELALRRLPNYLEMTEEERVRAANEIVERHKSIIHGNIPLDNFPVIPEGLFDFPQRFVEYEQITKKKFKPIYEDGTFTDLFTGKLHAIPEAAGKVRVIAIVDAWTQSLFSPLHDTLFGILKRIPNDGTFDQELSFLRAQEKSMSDSARHGTYSVDLSSATDRLPIKLQSEILNLLFGNEIGDLWAKLLVERPFVNRVPLGGLEAGSLTYYGTGQPMGCLSSWAMLALTHHFILQYCARNIYGFGPWNTSYEILGDDLVIFDREIYLEYLRVMSHIDVGTNPHKSLSSRKSKTFEFAKRTSIAGVDVSGLSWQQFLSTTGIKDRINLILNLGARGLLWKEGLLARLINFHSFSSKATDTDVTHGLLISLLSHFADKGVMSWTSALAYVSDPSKGEADLLECKVPVLTTLHDLVTMLSDSVLYRKGEILYDELLTLSQLEKRREMGAMDYLPYLGNDIYQTTLARLYLFEEDHEELPYIFASQLIKDSSLLFRGDKMLWSSDVKALYSTVLDMSLSLLYRGKSDQDVFDMSWKYIQEILTLGPESFPVTMEFRDKLEAYVSKFSFMKATKPGRDLKESPLHWLQIEISESISPTKNSPYWRLLQKEPLHKPVQVPKVDPRDDPIEDGRRRSAWDRIASLMVPMDKAKRRSIKLTPHLFVDSRTNRNSFR